MSPRWFALLAAVLFSTGGAAIKATTWNSWQVASGRSFVAAVAIAFLLPKARQSWGWPIAWAAAAYALTLSLFVSATKLTTSANAIFLQSSAPLYLVSLGPWLLKEKVSRREWLLLGAITCGMVLVFLAGETTTALAPNPALGNALAAASGLTWAFTVLGLRWANRQGRESMAVVLAGNCLVVLLCAPLAWPWPALTFNDGAALLYLGLVQIALAYWCLGKAVSGLGALETALLIMLEPALNPFWTWVLHGERPAPLALLGGAVILVATGIQALARR